MTRRERIVIGHGEPVFIVAEAGVNHNGDVTLAHKLIDAAATTGADAVKFQTFTAERLVSPRAAKANYQRETTGEGSQLAMLKALELPSAAWAELKAHCDKAGLVFMSSPFDQECADLLTGVGIEVLKLGSGEITNRPLIEHCALTGLPLIMSTGMATRAEVEAAISWFRLAFQRGVIRQAASRVSYSDGGRIGVMHCVSSYPAALETLNLRAIALLRDKLHVAVGFSDHSEGTEGPVLAVAAGACMIEKHITLDRAMAGPDHRASLEPQGFAEMARLIRRTEKVLGTGRKEPDPSERNTRDVARKSVVAVRAIANGSAIRREDIAILRPGTGIAPARLEQVVGRIAMCDIEAGEPLRPEWVGFPREGEESFGRVTE